MLFETIPSLKATTSAKGAGPPSLAACATQTANSILIRALRPSDLGL
jgi:hypothetical protein